MTVAVVLGVLAANLPAAGVWTAGRARPGLDFAGKHLMRGGIVLLGLKVSIMDVLGLGWLALVLIVGVVAASFGGTYLISRLFRLPPVTSLLVATGFSICGASAIGAMAAVVVKLTRVLLLAPVAALAGAHHRYAPRPENPADRDNAKLPPVVPLFVLGFVAMVGLRSTGWLAEGWLEAGAALQDILLGAALFGLGSAVRIRTLLHTGGRASAGSYCV